MNNAEIQERRVTASHKKITAAAISAAAFAAALFTASAFMITSFAEKTPSAQPAPPAVTDEPKVEAVVPMPEKNEEVRGVYIASVYNINFPSQKGLSPDNLRAELDDIVATCRDANLNTIYFQVRPSADALYDSAIFPVSEYLTGEQGSGLPDGFDPLAYIIEKANKNGISVHAWVNPLRVTVGSASAPLHDTSILAPNHPARQHPEYAIPYADGRLYFDCGIPEVRKLIADGVSEIVANYSVDGIIFDDYFYPYPTYSSDNTLAVFDDSASYEKYANGADLGDWRRSNVNMMIEDCFKAVKDANPECEFGVAPFGIWQNDNGTNGGSATSGLESYSAIYCDPTAWIEGGYVDYIAPQIYWRFTTSVARYDTLVRWWNTLLDGTDVDLIVSHGVYNYDTWDAPEDELRCQVQFARSELAYRGSILYGYASLKANSHGLLDEVRDVFKEKEFYSDVTSNGRDLIISIPYNKSYIDGANTFVIGTSDPTEPLYIDGKKVGRTKSGYFSLYLPLNEGKNTFVFSHKGKETEYIINRGVKTSSAVTYPTLSGPGISAVTPSYDYIGRGKLSVSVTAPRGSKVTAELAGSKITLTPTLYVPHVDGKYMKEVFTGSFNLTAQANEIRDLGKIKFVSTYGGSTYTAESANIKAIGSGTVIPVEVIKDDTNLKIELDSWYYDDYTAQSAGARDNAVSLSNGMYKLRCGGYISRDEVKVLEGVGSIPIAIAETAVMSTDGKATYFKIKVSENVPINCNMESNGEFMVALYNIDTSKAPAPVFADNPLFTEVRGAKSTKAYSYKYFFKLVDIENFYGFRHYYEDGYLIFEWKNPEVLPDTDKPLTGKTIVLDAGHGVPNPNALGPLGTAEGAINEAEFNLEIVMAAEKYLTDLGAEVIQIRDRECMVDIPLTERTQTLIEIDPDLMISIHQNSMPYTSDITKIRGVVGLYWADSGYMLTDIVGGEIATALNKLDRSPTKQRLAMVRNPKFPATLIETCFITSVEEYERMMKPDAVDTIARAIADGVLKFYAAQEKYVKQP